jgi:hypothetical protein
MWSLSNAGVDLDAPLEAWVDLTVADYRRRGLLRRFVRNGRGW